MTYALRSLLISSLFLFIISEDVTAANLINGSAEITNSRLSYIAGVNSGQAKTNTIIIDTAGNPDNDTRNLFPRDEICFADTKLQGCKFNQTFHVEKILTKSSFSIRESLPGDLTASDYVIVKQSSGIKLRFKTVSEVEIDGYISILIPAVDKAGQANDGFPDSSDRVISNGFDLNKLQASSVRVAGCDSENWSVEEPIAGSNSANHEIKIVRENDNCPAGTDITVLIDSESGVINPAPITTKHLQGTNDPYNLRIRTFGETAQVIDELFVKIGHLEGVAVSGTVGREPTAAQILLFGYTSPKALMKIESPLLSLEDFATETGYFEFTDFLEKPDLKELCLTSQDQLGRVSAPVCIPIPTQRDELIKIGPVVMPPTISLDKSAYFINQDIVISGQTLPNSPINMSFFNDRVNFWQIIKPIEAYSIPKIEARSDAGGNFSIHFPANYAESVRIFSQTLYNKRPSPKSITLAFSILQIWPILIILTMLITLGLLIFAAYLVYKWLHPYHISRHRAIVLAEKHPLALIED